MAIIDYPGLTQCLSTDGFPDRSDGTYLKFTDTGEQFLRVAGEWVSWELGLSFAPPTKSGSVITDEDGTIAIAFGTPFIDNAYTVALTCTETGGAIPLALTVNKSADGFLLRTVNVKNGKPLPDVSVSWLATRNYNE